MWNALQQEKQQLHLELQNLRNEMSRLTFDHAQVTAKHAECPQQLQNQLMIQQTQFGQLMNQRDLEIKHLGMQLISNQQSQSEFVKDYKNTTTHNEQLKKEIDLQSSRVVQLDKIVADLQKIQQNSSSKGIHAEGNLEQFLKTHVGSIFDIQNVSKQHHTGDLKITYTFGSCFPMKLNSQNGNVSLEERFPSLLTTPIIKDEYKIPLKQPLTITFLIENKDRRANLSSLEQRDKTKFDNDVQDQKPHVAILMCPVPIYDPTQKYELRQQNQTRCYFIYSSRYEDILPALFDGLAVSLMELLVQTQLQTILQRLGSQPEVQQAFEDLLGLTKYAVDQVLAFQTNITTSFNDCLPRFDLFCQSFSKMQTVYPKLVTRSSQELIRTLIQKPTVPAKLSSSKRPRHGSSKGSKKSKVSQKEAPIMAIAIQPK